tara:strand:+ start:7072 stop:7428 length:357 start_codon:yes stop_codon:yes gene_type:complete
MSESTVGDAYILSYQGDILPVYIAKHDWLNQMQAYVGGLIEPVNYIIETIGEVYVNEEGTPLGLQPNLLALTLFGGSNLYKGNVVIFKEGMNPRVQKDIDLVLSMETKTTKEWFGEDE